MKDEHAHGKKMARKGCTKVIYKGTFISDRSLSTPKKAIHVTHCFFWGVDSTKINFSTMYPPTYWKIRGGGVDQVDMITMQNLPLYLKICL